MPSSSARPLVDGSRASIACNCAIASSILPNCISLRASANSAEAPGAACVEAAGAACCATAIAPLMMIQNEKAKCTAPRDKNTEEQREKNVEDQLEKNVEERRFSA